MIHVVAIITAKSGMRDAILKEFHANMPAVHAEKGCIEYGPAIDADMGGFQTKVGADMHGRVFSISLMIVLSVFVGIYIFFATKEERFGA